MFKGHESRPVIRFDEVALEGVLVFRELFQVAGSQFLFNLVLVGRVDEGDAGTLETAPEKRPPQTPGSWRMIS